MWRRRLGLLALVGSLAVLLVRGGTPAGAQPADWVAAGPAVAAFQLAGPRSGAFFAWTTNGLQRSEDGGSSWVQMQLPPGAPAAPRGLAPHPDPSDHGTLYAVGEAGLYKATGLYRSGDGSASWTLIRELPRRPNDGQLEGQVLAVEISPADPQLVYAAMAVPYGGGMKLERSRDGGATWEMAIDSGPSSLCGWGVRLLRAHPTDPTRLFRSSGCYAGRNTADALFESRDQGVTWHQLYVDFKSFTWPDRLVGGAGANPTRYYLAAHKDFRVGGSALLRSDDDAATWTMSLDFPFAMQNGKRVADDLTPGGLTYDPAQPDHVWLALNTQPPEDGAPIKGAVRYSADGGVTWVDAGRPGLPKVYDLLLGSDGANLYAATDGGVLRLPLW